MNNLGIKSRVVFLATIPGLLFALILAGYAVSHMTDLLNQSLRDRGNIISTQLAIAAEYGVVSGNKNVLQQLVQFVISQEQEVNAVMIVDDQGKVLARSGAAISNVLLKQTQEAESRQLKTEKSVVFNAPIRRSLVELDDHEVTSQKMQLPPVVGHVYVELGSQTLTVSKQALLANISKMGVLGLFLSALIAWLIGRSITNPIQQIAQAVNKVGQGEYAHSIAENSSGELKTLQSGFNAMASRLKQAYEGMQEKINEATAQLRHQAHHDDLTGLINRREFESRLARGIKRVHEQHTQHVMCFIDLDQFKLVNDTCGHAAGDELLKQISQLLNNRMRDRDTLARIGGDEFGLLLENCRLIDAYQITNELLKIVRDYRFSYGDRVFNVGASIGLVVIDEGFDDASSVMRAADEACFSAKKAGRNQSFLFSHKDEEVAERHNAMQAISDIINEIDDQQFLLYYQPIRSISNHGMGVGADSLQHFEILIRKVNADGQIVLPNAFISSAERYKLMQNIDRWVIQHAFSVYRTLMDKNNGQCDYVFSINLSGTSLSDKTLLGFIREQLSLYAIPPRAICFEVTETATIVNLANTIQLISTLRSLGCRFALDDFGSGMSSFMYLKSLEVDFLKIDGSFVKDIDKNPIDYAMVNSIHNIAKTMNIQTVAEFVENEAVLEKITSIGIHYGQGTYLGDPVDIKYLIENAPIYQPA